MSQEDADFPEGGASVKAQEIGQKNSVEIFLTAFERSIRSAKVYAHGSGDHLLTNIFENVVGALDRALLEDETIDVQVKPLQMMYDRKVVYDNPDKKKSLAFLLHENGIRLISFKKGMTKDELIELIKVFSLDFSQPDLMDLDLYCAVFEKTFDHVEVVGADLVAEAQKARPEIKANLEAFEAKVKKKIAEKKIASARRLRGDDLKVLEEFHLSPSMFSKSDEEISKIVKNITASHASFRQERETLERLILMGFHFLLQEGNLDQSQVGRDLVVQVSVMILDQSYLDMYQALIKKVYQVHKDRPEQRGEFQKILDQIFHIDHYDSFRRALGNANQQAEVCKILLAGPPSTVRLMTLLLPVVPGAHKIFGEFILTHLPEHTGWLMETLAKQPDLEAWEHLVNVLALRPNPQFSKFLVSLVECTGETMKVKVLRQCANIGTPESLDIFRRLLRAEEVEKRLLALDLLSHAKNRPAVMMLKGFVDSPDFEKASPDEKEVAYRSLIRMAGEACYAWFEQLWFQKATGLFKAKAQNEKRGQLARAALSAEPQFMKKILEKDSSDLQPELKELILKGLQSAGKKE